MAGHMHQMARIRDQSPQDIACFQRFFRKRGHFHQVHIEVQDAGMFHAAGQGHMMFKDAPCLLRGSTRGHRAAAQVPHVPRRQVHQCIDKSCRNVGIIGEFGRNLAHRIGKGRIPGGHIVDRIALGVAGRQGGDQRGLCWGHMPDLGKGRLRGVIGFGQRLGAAFGIVKHPRHVVVWPGGIGLTPVGHGAGRISSSGVLETHDRLFVVKAVNPVQAPVEPLLRLRILGRDNARKAPQIIQIVHIGLLAMRVRGRWP